MQQEIWLLPLPGACFFAKSGHMNEITYHDFRDQLSQAGHDLGFEGHMAMAAAMV